MTRSNLKRVPVEDVDEDGGARMGFLDHLDELRMRRRSRLVHFSRQHKD